MTKRMLIDAAHPEETRVVLLDGNQLEDFDVEVSSRRQLKGNIYLAKVVRVEPSLQAAFVDYGGNRHGFLAFSEIHPDYYQIPVSDRESLAEAEYEEAHVEEPAPVATREEGVGEDEGNHNHNGGESPSLEIVGGDETDDFELSRKPRSPHAKQYKIQEVIKRRQVLLVQVVKEERGNKGAALTTYMSLAGRYCVLMPNTARGGGISRKITNAADRKELKSILSSLEVPEGMAVILRTAGIGRTKAEIKRDFEYLIRLWNNVRDITLQSTAPTLVHEEGDIVRRSIRDLYSRDIEEVCVQGDEAYKAAKEFMKLLIPSHARRVKQHKETDAPLLRHFGVEDQLDAIHNPIVHLPSGGYIVINPTEALVSVDVNSGKSTKERNIEETALKTNLEAASELARQLRLRDLAGLIVIDFIDMEVSRNNAQVERRMKDALKHDRARIQVGRISPFGLLEMSRQRLRPSLIETSSEPCPHCGGTGIRRSTESTALVVLRAIDEEGANHRAAELTVHVPTSVALYILNHKRAALAELEAKHSVHVLLSNDDSLIPPDLRLERTKNIDGETISEMVATVRADTQEEANRKRRRRRRGGRGRDDEEGVEFQSAESADHDADGDEEPEAEAESERKRPFEAAEGSEEDEEKKGKRRRRSRRGGRRRRKAIDAVGGVEGGVASEGQGESPDENLGEEGDEAPSAVASEAGEEASANTDGVKAEGEDRPKRRRSRRRRKPADAAAMTAGDAQSVEGDDGVEGEEAVADESAAEPLVKKANGKDEDDTTTAPKPRRTRTRRKPSDAPAPEQMPAAAPATAPATTPADGVEVVAAPEPEPEPQPEPVVATPPTPSPAAPAPAAPIVADEPDKPKKKGWWNLGA